MLVTIPRKCSEWSKFCSEWQEPLIVINQIDLILVENYYLRSVFNC